MQQTTAPHSPHVATRGPYRIARNDPLGLTARERCVLELLQQGLSNRDMARRLCRSERTVEHHVSSLFAKLGIGSRRELPRHGSENRVPTGASGSSVTEKVVSCGQLDRSTHQPSTSLTLQGNRS